MKTKKCSKCGEEKVVEDFYFNKKRGKYEAQCKACKLAYQKERHKQVMKDPNLHNKRLITQSKYRDRYRYKIAEKERLKRRKMGIPPQQYINKEKLLDLYRKGYPVQVIAEKCGCSYYTVKLYAQRNGVRRGRKKQRLCYNCKEYPCFFGIETISSNLALTCPKYK